MGSSLWCVQRVQLAGAQSEWLCAGTQAQSFQSAAADVARPLPASIVALHLSCRQLIATTLLVKLNLVISHLSDAR